MTSSHQRLKSGLGPAHQAPLAEPAPEPVDHKDDQCQGQRHGPEDSEICWNEDFVIVGIEVEKLAAADTLFMLSAAARVM